MYRIGIIKESLIDSDALNELKEFYCKQYLGE